jgi:hypothetical protein
MIIEGEIATTHLIEQVLKACGSHGITYRKKYLSNLKIKDFHPNTIPLFVRCGEPSLVFWIDLLQSAKRPYIYYIDDNFWRIEGDSLLASYYRHPLIRRSLELAVVNAACVLTNSSELAKFLASLNTRITVLPAFFDFSLIADVLPEVTDEIRIGFAGSPSRIDDLEIVQPLISPILDEYPNVVFEFAGVLPLGIVPNDRIRFFPHTNEYNEFIRFQVERNWAIGLAPLIDNESNRCKTNNKYREYGACKITGIYSDVKPYQRSVVSGVNGLLVGNSTTIWLAAVKRLLGDPLECKEFGKQAYTDVLRQHCVEQVSVDWATCIYDVDKQIDKDNRVSLQLLSKRINFRKTLQKIDSLRIQVSLTYTLGGVKLVIRKSINRLLRGIKRR